MKYPYMAPEGEPAPGGTTPPAFNPAEAKTFLSSFVPDPKILDSMQEPDLKGYHERVTGAIDKARPNNKWPDNWRDTYSAGDAKKMERLTRYASPGAAFDALIAAQNKISEAGLKEPFPGSGTPEQQKAWREANGIPESPDKYELKFDNGFVIGEEDKPQVGEFLKLAHQHNIAPDTAKALVQWNFEAQKKELEQLHEAERTMAAATQENLRAEWGQEYRPTMNRIHGLLDTAPPEVKDGILGGRLADGTPIFSSPEALKFLANLALEINPATTLVPNAGGNVGQAIGDEITKLEQMMSNRSSEYWKGPMSEKHQARYRQLVEARDKMDKKGKAA